MKIIVTGSGSGLGGALLKELTALGHEVIEYDSKDGYDVRYPALSLDHIESLDVLINCAGVNTNDWFENVAMSDLRRVMDINAFSIVKMTQALLEPLKRSRGVVIN